MIEVITPNNSNFDYKECKALYDKYQNDIGDDNFDEVIKRTYFYSFYIKKTKELLGCIYFFVKGHKKLRLYVNGFANRKHHKLNVECLRESLSWWTCPVYAYTEQKTAKLCLNECNFEKIKSNLYIYRRD